MVPGLVMAHWWVVLGGISSALVGGIESWALWRIELGSRVAVSSGGLKTQFF